jgi:hypothetical protein
MENQYRKEVLKEVKRKRKGLPNSVEVSSAEESSDSQISQEGVPDKDLKFVVSPKINADIETRRDNRRLESITSRVEYEAM